MASIQSIQFPKMLNSNSTRMVKDLEATKQNAFILLQVEEGELFGDPFFGVALKKYLFNQNNVVLKDILVDNIYTKLALFMPQLRVNRNQIKVVFEMGKLYCKFKAINQQDMQLNQYALVLYDDENNR